MSGAAVDGAYDTLAQANNKLEASSIPLCPTCLSGILPVSFECYLSLAGCYPCAGSDVMAIIMASERFLGCRAEF